MAYNLSNVPKIDSLLCDGENRRDIAKSLNLKYNVWKHANGVNYHILKYDKEWLSNELVKTVGLLRSLIFKDDGTIVCFAPPKSLPVSELSIDTENDVDNASTTKTEPSKEYVAESFVEGTMINVFYEPETNTWEIATRSSVGGRTCFFMEGGFKEENTFSYMFNEVCSSIGLNLQDLNKKYVYSFVMQHPRNRIVKIIKKMALYLVNVYQIEGKTIHIVPINNIDEQFGIKPNTVKTINSVSLDTNVELNNCVQTMASMNTPYDQVGVIIKSNMGERYKFRNPTYEHVRKLRGNNPKLQYQYLTLRQSGMMTEYLRYYSEHRKVFNEFREIIHAYTSELFSNYIRCYIRKEKELKEFPEKFKTHMFALHHEIYLKKLMPEKRYINKEEVISYFNGLHPAKQMFILNYDVRKNHIASEKKTLNDTAEASASATTSA